MIHELNMLKVSQYLKDLPNILELYYVILLTPHNAEASAKSHGVPGSRTLSMMAELWRYDETCSRLCVQMS